MDAPANAPLSRAAQPSADHLVEVLGLLWPAPSELALLRGRRGGRSIAVRAAGSAAVRDYVVVPDARRPRVVVPAGPARVSAAALRASRTSSSPRTRLQLALAATAARAGAMRLLPDRVRVRSVAASPSDVVCHLADALGRQVEVSLLVGPQRAAQKPVLQVLTPRGELLAFAKLGVNDLTRTLVRHEAQVLSDLGGLALRSVRVPAVLHHGTWNGHELLVQEALTRGAAPEHDGGPLLAAMVEVAGACGTRAEPLATSSFWQHLSARVDASSHGAAPSLAELARRVAAERGDEVITFGSWHGDWAPWNMLADGDHALVWDWETFDDDVPSGFDRVHFVLQQQVVLRDVDPALALSALLERAPVLLEPFGVPSRSAPLVVVLYAMHLVVGLLETGEQHSRLSRVDAWLSRWLPDAYRAVLAAGAP